MRKALFSISFLIYLISPHLAGAQGGEVFSGKVVDISGNGMPGVQVSVNRTCGTVPGQPFNFSASGETLTDAEGRYRVELFPSLLFSPSSCPFRMTATVLTRAGFGFYPSTVAQSGGNYLGLEQPEASSVSAASYRARAPLAPQMIATAFGSNLAEIEQAATSIPLPTTLAGRRVLLKDVNGLEKAAELFYVSPTQINYLIPAELAEGSLVVKVVSQDRVIRAGVGLLERVSPGIFTANMNGEGVPAALVARVKAGGVVEYEPVAQFDAGQNKFVPLAIDFGPDTESLFLVLFGTGWRHVELLEQVTARLGGVDTRVTYAGLQPDFAGLDQMNISIPRSLAGRGEIDVEVAIASGAFFPHLANVVKINLR